MQKVAAHPEGISSVVIADSNLTPSDRLVVELCARGIETWLAKDTATLQEIVVTQEPDVVLLELKLADGSWRKALGRLPPHHHAKVAILTSYGSVATAVAAMQAGVSTYVVKPVTADQLLRLVMGETASKLHASREDFSIWSLDQAVWEIISQAVESCGSISGAARFLRLDRRSLQRRLGRTRPVGREAHQRLDEAARRSAPEKPGAATHTRQTR